MVPWVAQSSGNLPIPTLYINNLNNHLAQKFSVLSTLVYIPKQTLDVEHLEDELKTLQKVFAQNGYGLTAVDWVLTKEKSLYHHR